MKIRTESDLYEPVRAWFQGVLSRRFPRCQVRAYNTSRTRLASFIAQRGLQAQFPQSGVWDIQADITALVTGRPTGVAFIECKTGPITLRDVGQLLGYCRVAHPLAAMLVSLQPPSATLRALLCDYGRYDVLEYDDGRRILLTRWDPDRSGILHAETLPPGEHL